MKKFTLLFCLALIHLSSFAQCDIPSSSTTNTGANMTVMLTPDFINNLPPMSGNDYLVATTQVGLTVGVIYWIDPDPDALAQLSFGTNVSLAIWGDDSGTDIVDGALANELISFQIVSGTSVHNGEFPIPINYTTNSLSFQSTSAVTALCIVGCMDETADNYDPDAIFYSGCITSCTDCACEGDIPEYVSLEPTGSNMSILLHSSFIESLPPFLTANSYIIATGSESGQIGGTALLGTDFRDGDQALLAIWADEGIGNNIGLVGNEEIIYTYYDGPNVYNVDLMYSIDGTGDPISSISTPMIYSTNGAYIANGSNFDQTCEIEGYSLPGCMSEWADNYDVNATIDDGSCSLVACTSDWADNYDVNATIDDGSCSLEACMDESSFNFNSNATTDDGSCFAVVTGCMEVWADNFNDYDSDGESNVLTGIDGIDVNTADNSCSLAACMSDWAVNFDSNATIDDGSCSLDGCMSDWADNYNANATSDNGSCSLEACMSDWADNYNANATSDNGSCSLEACMSEWADNYDVNATIDDGSCSLEACMSEWADNYDVNATIDDGSCSLEACMSDWADNYDVNTTIDDGSCSLEACMSDWADNYDVNATIDDGSCSLEACMSEWADNYDANATIDVGCSLLACIDTLACNYNELGTVDNDLCIYASDLDACATCSGETDGSGTIVDGDADNDGLCDIDEVYGCVNPLATNYNANISPTDADDSCLFDQDYSDSLAYIIDSLNLDNSFSTAHIMMLQNQVTNLEQQLDLVWIINDENQEQYEETLSNLQAELAEIDSINIDNQIAYFQNLVNLDNPGPYEVVVQAYMILAEQYEECNPYVYGLIENNLNLGWNTIGYNILYPTPVEYQFASIINDVVLVKNNGGEIYWPNYNFNAIGDMIPGQGYQVRISSVIDDFIFVE